MKKLLFMCMAAALTPPFVEGFAQNPIIQTRFTADPAPYVLGDTCYLYTSVDNEEGEGYQKTFWQLYTSTDMVNWTDRGTVASLADFSWAGDNGAWAPHAISRSGKWFLYVPIQLRGIGVLMGNSPTGPWRDVRKGPLINQDIRDIDPTVFIDKDEQAYLYWGNNGLWYARLSRNMMAINGDYVEIPRTVESVGGYEETYVDENGQEQTRLVGTDKYEEGPWVYERNGKYYLIYAAGGIPEHLSYSMSDSPTGPWKYCGQIMDPPEGSFTTHPGIVDFKGRSFIHQDGSDGSRDTPVALHPAGGRDHRHIPWCAHRAGRNARRLFGLARHERLCESKVGGLWYNGRTECLDGRAKSPCFRVHPGMHRHPVQYRGHGQRAGKRGMDGSAGRP